MLHSKGAHTNTTKTTKYKGVSVSSSSGLVVFEIQEEMSQRFPPTFSTSRNNHFFTGRVQKRRCRRSRFTQLKCPLPGQGLSVGPGLQRWPPGSSEQSLWSDRRRVGRWTVGGCLPVAASCPCGPPRPLRCSPLSSGSPP